MADLRLKGMDVRYGGRTFEFKVIVNTDASLGELQKRLLAAEVAVSGPRRDMEMEVAGRAPVYGEVVWEVLR